MMNPSTQRSTARDQLLLQGVMTILGKRWGLAPAQATALALRCRTLAVRRGAAVASRGMQMPGVLVLGYGTIKLALRHLDGAERIVRLVAAGETFGEEAALPGRPCPYDALALADSRLVGIPAAALLALMEQDPGFARRIALVLAERNLELLGELEAATTRRSSQRLASYLVSLAGPQAAERFDLRLPVTKTLIAARLGIKKETLSRLLRSLSADGLIRVSRRDIAVLDRTRLVQMAAPGAAEAAGAVAAG